MMSELTNEEKQQINLFIAEKLFGYQWWRSSTTGKRGIFLTPPEWFKEKADMTEPLATDWNYYVKDYTSDFAAIAEARTKIAERGLQGKFIKELNRVLRGQATVETYWSVSQFDLVNASTQNQALAIYETLKEVENENL